MHIMYYTYNTTFNISLYALFIFYTHINLLIIDYRLVYVDSDNSVKIGFLKQYTLCTIILY